MSAFDFAELNAALHALADGLDDVNLNELPQLKDIETSAESQARYFFEQLSARRGLGRLVVLDLAAGEFPQAREVLALLAARDERAAPVHHDGERDGNGRRLHVFAAQ